VCDAIRVLLREASILPLLTKVKEMLIGLVHNHPMTVTNARGVNTMATVDSLLKSQIKDVIADYPEAGTILAEHGVGCVTCQVGTCLLKDIVGIHGLSPAEERAIMAGLAAVLDPSAAAGADIRVTAAAPEAAAQPGLGDAIRHSPPMGQLVEEHRLIKRWVAQIPAVVAAMDLEQAWDRELIRDGIDFIRSYADHFHHAKEEDILFAYFDRESPAIQVFLTEHEIARSHVRAAEAGVEARDRETVAEYLTAYGELLASHIKREDEVLYPWMDRELSTSQVGELYARFAAVDEAAGPRFTKNYTALVERIEDWTQKVQVPR
jgi:hemerythrin-like domain-containing protein